MPDRKRMGRRSLWLLRGAAILVLIFGTWCTLSGAYEFYLIGKPAPPQRPDQSGAQYDYATNPYWLKFFGKLQLAIGIPTLTVGAGCLWFLRRRGVPGPGVKPREHG